MRKPIIIGNWKMNKTVAETKAFIDAVDAKVLSHADFGVAPGFLSLQAASEAKQLIIAAQNCHFEANGAYTGEVSIPMLQDLGISFVIVGHSERRQYFNETDETVNLKTTRLLEANMVPVVCVGETEAQFDANETEAVVRTQTRAAFKGIDGSKAKLAVIAYEPVWAIGTGKTATNEIAQNVCAVIRDEIKQMFDQTVADAIRIQYGGSVKPEGIKALLEMPDIDGALVGGASLDATSFIALIENSK